MSSPQSRTTLRGFFQEKTKYESQDIEYEFLDIGNEMMSASIFWGFARYTGTPKTTDTTLALLWNRSSQAEWVIRCEHCNKFNIPNPEQDLLKMIGKRGPVCAKCGQPVFPKNGGYVHARPERQLSFPGYHISQTVHPLHILSQAKWNRLLDKIENYAPLALYNEVFGWPYDAATSPLTMSDLDRVMKAQKRSGARIVSMVGLRYQADFQYALHLVRIGAVGKVKLVRAQKSYRLGNRPAFYRHRESYGGTIPWVGSHAIDWILAFSGSPFHEVYATQTADDNFNHGELEVACQCLFTMKNGVQAMASIDYLRPPAAPSHGDDRVRIAGTDGILEVIDGKVLLIDKEGKRELPVPPAERELFSDFANSLTGKQDCLVPESETFELARACLLARESADTGKIIRF